MRKMMMRPLVWAVVLSLGVIGFAGCKKEEMKAPEKKTEQKTDPTPNPTPGDENQLKDPNARYAKWAALPRVTLEGELSTAEQLKLTADKLYELKGIVTVAEGKELTIEAGTMLVGRTDDQKEPAGVLVIRRGAKITAEGTAENPIIFTSYKLVDDDAATKPAPGDFGGVVILGKATVNAPGDQYIEGLKEGEAAYSYGGAEDADNSGSLLYVRIEYAGYILGDTNEINGLTCGGVGNGTKLSHIQVSWGKDDSFEFFGGTVNADHLISYACDDDNFDFDNGFCGTLTHCLALADSRSTHSASGGKSDTNGIELDNNNKNQDATFALKPQTHPTLKNLTIIGTSTCVQDAGFGGNAYKFAARIRRGGAITIENALITGYPDGIVIDGDANTTVDNCVFTDVKVHAFAAPFTMKAAADADKAVPAGVEGIVDANAAAAFGMNEGFVPESFDPSGATHGAFKDDATWHKGWSSFVVD